MSEPETVKKNSVAISLPRAFYDAYMRYKLWEEYSSFSDWVRDAVRESRDKWRVRRSAESSSVGHQSFG